MAQSIPEQVALVEAQLRQAEDEIGLALSRDPREFRSAADFRYQFNRLRWVKLAALERLGLLAAPAPARA